VLLGIEAVCFHILNLNTSKSDLCGLLDRDSVGDAGGSRSVKEVEIPGRGDNGTEMAVGTMSLLI